MATLTAVGANSSGTVVLSNAQTGTGASTNTADRGGGNGQVNPGTGAGTALLTIVSTVGATPTLTVDVQGSMDNSDWFNVAYATTAAPETPVVTSLTITTATTNRLIMRANQPWRFLRLNLSSNTNVTITATLYVF